MVKNSLLALWRLMQVSRRLYLAAILAAIFSTVLNCGAPRIFQAVVDYAVGEKAAAELGRFPLWLESIQPREYWATHLQWAFCAVLVLALFAAFFGFLDGRLRATACERIARRLRGRLYGHLQRLPCTYHDKAQTGDLVQRCSSDVETVRMFLGQQVSEVGNAIFILGAALAFMIPLDGFMTLISVSLIPVIVPYSVVFLRRIGTAFERADQAEGAMTATIQENLTGIRVVKAFARADFEARRFGERNREYRDHWFRLIRTMAAFWSVSDLLCMMQVALVLGIGAYRVVHDSEFTLGMLFAFITYVNLFLWPVRHMGRVLADMGKAIVSIGRIEEILQEAEETNCDAVSGRGTEIAPVIETLPKGHIEFRQLTFGHTDGKHALNDVSFTVEAGQTLALVGPSGSGKSTIANLLLRFYDYSEGVILFDGVELREMPRRELRARISSVLQEPFLFSRSLRENILLGRSSAAESELMSAAEDACLTESVQRFEEGLDTLVGERGVTLSGGQRQRVAIARALLRDAPVLLLDDALSAVDAHTETLILEALRRRRGRRTTLVIAHRISTLAGADRILVLEGGRVTQFGSHDDLLGQPGLYRRLWHLQTNIEEELKER